MSSKLHTSSWLARSWLAFVALAALAGCSAGSGNGPGDAGQQGNKPPVAKITPIGFPPASDGSITVRSGAQVLLSGKDSDDPDEPILKYEWEGADTATKAVRWIKRSENAMTFRAPVPQGGASSTDLAWNLTVTSVSGQKTTSRITVHVLLAPDSDDFLLTDLRAGDAAAAITVVPSVAAAAQASFDPACQCLPFVLHVDKRVTYRKRSDGVDGTPTGNVIVPGITLSGRWLQAYGIATAPADLDAANREAANPHFVLRPPRLDADEVNYLIQDEPAGDAARGDVLDLAEIDSAEVSYEFTLEPTTYPNQTLVIALLGGDGQRITPDSAAGGLLAPATASVSRRKVLESAPGVESAQTARAYYDAIDPGTKKDTLEKWLVDNCMDPVAPGYGAKINAVYVNNFDLGFGRDMYFQNECTAARRQGGATLLDGESASVVVNYPSLEAAANRIGAFLAVAMEYRHPREKSGDTYVVRTDLPKIVSFYTFAPDPKTRAWKRVLSANFDGRGEKFTPGNCTVCHGGKPNLSYPNPEDQDIGATFLPWDVNSFLFSDTDTSFTDDLSRSRFTKAAQLPAIKSLNEAMLGTLPVGRNVDLHDLVTDWINPAKGYDAVPVGWVGHETLYKGVIAQHCRACHLQRTRADGTHDELQFASYDDFLAYATPVDPASPSQVEQVALRSGIMPGSRLTADRFWGHGAGSSQNPSPPEILAAELGFTGTPLVPTAVATYTSADLQSDGTVPTGSTVRLSAADSTLASSYQWTVTNQGVPVAVVGATTRDPAFVASQSGTYVATLTVTDSAGRQSTPATVDIEADNKPVAGPITVDIATAAAESVDLFDFVTLGDGVNSVRFTLPVPGNLSVSPAPATDGLVCSGTATCVVQIGSLLGGGTITYTVTDADGDVSAPANITVNDLRTFTAPGKSFTTGPKVDFPGGVSLSLNAEINNLLAANGFSTGTPTNVRRVSGPTARGQTNAAAGVTGLSRAFTYVAPAFFVSDQPTEVIDTFSYVIDLLDSGGAVIKTSEPGQVDVRVNATRKLSTIYPTMNSSCGDPSGGCHSGSNGKWNLGNSSSDAYTSISGCANCVDFVTPTSSYLYVCPQGPSGPQSSPGTLICGYQSHSLRGNSQLWNDILKWINEGAYNN